jgi:hypothetical protein
MAINVRSTSNIDRKIDASVPVALNRTHAPQQNSMNRLINPSPWPSALVGFQRTMKPLEFQQIAA